MYMGIVIGTKEKIDSIIRRVGLVPDCNVPKYKSVEGRSAIVSKLEFADGEAVAFCIKVDKIRIVGQIKKKLRKRDRYLENKRIWAEYNRLLLHEVRGKITGFVNFHRCTLSDVVFQCDGDCRDFAKDNGLRHAGEGNVYALSDAVAWANNRNLEPNGVRLIDITKILQEKLESRILR